MRRVIYIVGLSHSGSTLLDLLLGAHPRFVGLGEVGRVMRGDALALQDPANHPCTCGSTLPDCPFWSRVVDTATAKGNLSFEDKYETVYKVFDEQFAVDDIAVDSSKRLGYLKYLMKVPDVSLSVLHLVRDVRAYAISQINSRTRKGRRLTAAHSFHFFREWHQYNMEIEQFLVDAPIPSMQIRYETLCLNTEETLREICQFMAVPYDERMSRLEGSKSHIVSGNRMRRTYGTQQIIFDHTWENRSEWRLPSLLCRRAMRYNRSRAIAPNQI